MISMFLAVAWLAQSAPTTPATDGSIWNSPVLVAIFTFTAVEVLRFLAKKLELDSTSTTSMINKLWTRIEEQDRQLMAQNQRLSEQDDRLNMLEATNQEQAQEIRNLKAQNQLQQREIVELREERGRLQREVEDLRRSLRGRRAP